MKDNAPTLLLYSLLTEPFPLQCSADSGAIIASLTVNATNNTASDVNLSAVEIQIPIGIGASELTNDSTTIAPLAPTGWVMQQVTNGRGFSNFIFLPVGGGTGRVQSDSSLDFIFNGIEVNTVTGTVQVSITEGSNGCTPGNCPVSILSVTKFPNGWGNVTFTASRVNISQGGNTSLNWAGPAGATYQLQFYTLQTGIVNLPPQGAPPYSNQGQYPGFNDPPLTLQQTTVFTLLVSENIQNRDYSATMQTTVTVEQPPVLHIKQFEVNSTACGVGDVLSFQWIVEDANTCWISINGSYGVEVPAAPDIQNSCCIQCNDGKTFMITNGQGFTYGTLTLADLSTSIVVMLSASNQSGNVQAPLSIGLLGARIDSYSYQHDPEIPMAANISWNVLRAYSVTLNGGGVGANESFSYKIGYYALSAQGFGTPVNVNMGP